MRRKWMLVAITALASGAWMCSNGVAPSTGLTGTVLRGPVHPVCQVNQPCDAPFAANFEVRRNGQQITTFTSDDQGHFTVRLVPGSYVIVPAADAPIMSPQLQTKDVVVGPEGLTSVDLMFDTGIR